MWTKRNRRQRQQSVLDSLLGMCGLVRKATVDRMMSEHILVEGHVTVMGFDPVTGRKKLHQYLGQNVVTERFRINVAGLIARPSVISPPGVTYDDDPGFNESDVIFPVQLSVGVGTTPALTTDTALDQQLEDGSSPKFFDLQRILFRDNVIDYGTDPIHVGFYFDIPAGTLFDDPDNPGGPQITNVDFQEWGLHDGNDNLLARKVQELTMLADLDLTVKWEIRT